MKTITEELRMIFAEWLLNLAFNIAPQGHTDGRKLKSKIAEYIHEVL